MALGGYQIIDFKGYAVTPGQSFSVDGIHEKIAGSKKATLITGLVIADVEYPEFFAPFTNQNPGRFTTQVRIAGDDMGIEVTEDDNVTIVTGGVE